MDVLSARQRVQEIVQEFLFAETMPTVYVQRNELETLERRSILVLAKDKQEHLCGIWNDFEFFKHFEMEELEEFILDRFPNHDWAVYKMESRV